VSDNVMLNRAANQQLSLGVFVNITDPKMIEIAAYAGFDFIRLDLEHNMVDMATLGNQILTANYIGIPVVVRTPILDDITRLLDYGADGVIVPGVRDRQDALEVVDMAKYAPLGQRGGAASGRCTKYGAIPFNEYTKTANDNVCLTIQIENKTALENIDDILSVQGIDMVASGKNDLAQSMGFAGQPGHPEVIAAENRIIRKALEYGKYPTMMAGTPARVQELMAMGVYNVTLGIDCGMILTALKKHLAAFPAR
jgi:2-keto-3-deoxy-L-rhamnonate aldolase RhmA